jgi:hypothetical protein
MEIINVPVPADRLLEVYRLLGGPSTKTTSATKDLGQELWTDAMLESILREASPTIQRLARYLAEHPGEEITTERVASALELYRGWNSLAGALGAFGRKLTNRGLSFPWESWYSAEDGKSRMRMDRDFAARVLAVL